MRKFPKLGIYVVMFTDIFKTFAQFFVVCFLFIVAFGLGFHILLYNQVSLWCMSQLPTYIATRFWTKLGMGILKLATHLAILYADRANLIASDFRHRLMRTHLAIFFVDGGDVAVLKTHVIESLNLMGWLYWRFTAINVEDRDNGHTWRMPANLIADI